MQEVTAAERSTAPYSAVCYITTTFAGGITLRGSGTVIGPNDVLTAMHMVFQPDYGGWATSVSVTPGADTSPFEAPFGTFTDDHASLDGRTPSWDPNGDGLLTDDEAQNDLAVIGLHSRIGAASGWLQAAQRPEDFAGTTAGFPVHTPPGAGVGMMSEAIFADASALYGVYDVGSSLGPGGSGGPLFYISNGQAFVAGVLSSGNATESTYAALFGAGTWDWLAGVTAANDSLMPGNQQSAITGTAGADLLLGDALDNIVTAGAGDDTLTGAGGNDTLDGGDGLDSAGYSGARAGYSLGFADSAFTISDNTGGRDGADRLLSIERLKFADGGLALDVGGNAGIAAKIIGAVFGAGTVSAHPDYAGIGLWDLDHGMSYGALVQLALQARLGAQPSDAAVVDLLYTNVIGESPSTNASNYYVGLLQSGQYSQSALGVFAAEAQPNAENIGLAGLAGSGLAYEPLG